MKTDNELIAEFMGFKYRTTTGPFGINDYIEVKQTKNAIWQTSNFETSWDWLMPVVEKIKNILHELQKARPANTACQGDLIEVDIHCALREVNILMVYQAVLEFIKWYNQHPKP